MTNPDDIRLLLDRFARLWSAEQRSSSLNAVQHAALEYLARANRFSRNPAIVADYLATTRGTASQTVKSLIAKGFLSERRSLADRRIVELDVTESGRAALNGTQAAETAVQGLTPERREALESSLASVVKGLAVARKGKVFGLCARCRHHKSGPEGRSCALLDVALTGAEADQLCHEFAQ